MSKKIFKDTEWVQEQIPVKLDDNDNIINKKTGKPIEGNTPIIIGEGKPTKDINPDKEGVLYIDKTTGVICVCTSNEKDNNVWECNCSSNNDSNSSSDNDSVRTSDKLDIFNDGSCIALYQLDGNANDTGGEYNGTWKGNEDYANGKLGEAAKFDGKSYIDTGSYFNNMKSVSLWFYGNNNESSIIHFSKNGENTFVLWFNVNNHSAFYLNNKGHSLSQDFKKNTWYHVVLTYNGKLYVNGTLLNNFKINVDSSAFNRNCIISADRDTENNGNIINDNFNGLVDHIRIFNRTLTEDEVKELYKEGGN